MSELNLLRELAPQNIYYLPRGGGGSKVSAAGKLLGNNEACFCNEECEMYRQHFAVWTLRTGGHCGTGKHKSKVISGAGPGSCR